MSRLDRFMPVKEVAQVGAAIGHSFSYELIAAVAPHAGSDLDQALGQLTASGLAFRHGTPPDAIYSFKHALVQDAAYDSLLKSRRQELHGKIASVIKGRFSNVEEIEPELLAYHYTEAKLFRKAIPLWHKAGKLALKRMALLEAIRHLERGLDLIAALPQSAERDGWELDLRTALGTSWMALRGWQAQEVWDNLHPALALADSLHRIDALLPILYGLHVNVVTKGRVAESLTWVRQMLNAAEAYHEPELLIVGHRAAVTSYLWLGDLIRARQHADEVLSLYSERGHSHLADIINQDSKTVSLSWKAHATWMLGYPDQAIEISKAKDTYARRRGHPFDLGWAMSTGAQVLDHLREPEEELKRIEEAERLSCENSIQFVRHCLVPLHTGVALIRLGKTTEGMAALRAGLAIYEGSGGRANTPYLKSVLAEGIAHSGDYNGALCLIEELIDQIERPGWEERHYYAEILRIKGWLLSLKGDWQGAERNYLASLDWARHQQAKSWELRTAMSYARLMRDQGQTNEAYDLLAPIYGWFTEGFGTKDLKEAKALVEELQTRATPAAVSRGTDIL